ncbi:hypothetical protein PJL18_03327 [Paenarthrobacter nicotinovorans]|nr:hypothetical protein [Paenarthrobacter nicotinovorans]
MALQYDVGLRHGEHLTGGDPHLPFNEVDSRDQLSDGMLHLQPGVHLHEEELIRMFVGHQELDGSGAAVIDRTRCVAGRLADPRPVGSAVRQ